MAQAQRAADKLGFGQYAHNLELVSRADGLLGSQVLTFCSDNWFSKDVVVVLTVDRNGDVVSSIAGFKED